jgi:tight adherence protein B
MLYPVATFLLVAGAITGAYWLFVVRIESRNQSALLKRLKPETLVQKRSVLLREVEAMSSIGPLDRLLRHYSASMAPLKQTLDDSGLPLTVSKLILGSLSLGFLAMLVTMANTGVLWLAVVGGAAAALLPIWLVTFARTRRIRQFEEQFPEAVELIARSLRAGHAFATGLQLVADEMPAPAGPEFKMLYERQTYGAQLPDALRTFAQRIPSLDARFFVTAVLTQREAGGNLSEVLDRLGSVMRERFRIKREVRVRSAHGRMTAAVLAGMPPVLALLMFMGDPSQVYLMYNDPLGFKLLIAGAGLEVLGLLVIRKLVNIEY